MQKLNVKQKTSLGIVGAIVAAAFYLFGGIMGWWNTVIKSDEPAKKIDPAKVEAVVNALPDVKPVVESIKEEKKAAAPVKKAATKSTAKKAAKKAAVKKVVEEKK